MRLGIAAALLVAVSGLPALGLEGSLHPRPWADLTAALSEAQIAVLGEVHDNPIHHRNQATLVSELAPRALVFEMLSPEQAAAGQDIAHSDAQALGAGLGWDGSGWPPFAEYHPIFAAAPQARLYGAAVPRSETRRAMELGAAIVLDRADLLPALPAPEQSTREAEQLAAHCDALPAELLPKMVEAQRLRDASFALTALQALRETGGPVAVITGNGHSRYDRGLEIYLSRVDPALSVLSVGQLETAPDALPPFDFFILTAEHTRPDPCAAFR